VARKKFSNLELEPLIREGLGVSEIARKLGVSKGSVSKRLKELRVGITKDVALRSASQIVDRQINAMDQLNRINSLIHKELNYIEENIETAKGEERRELQDQRLKHVAEVRKQLHLLLDIAQALYNAEEVKAFQETVLEEIGRASPEIQERIIEGLQQRRAIRSTFEFAESAVFRKE
jgi:DNA-binding transcriptional regulator GbsR (MarR family)